MGRKDQGEGEGEEARQALVNGGIERWLTMLRVYWVLDLGDDPAPSWWSWMTWIHQAQSWIPAVARIVETIRSTSTLPLPDPCSHTDTGDDEEQAVVPNQFLLLMRVTTKILQRVKSKLVPNKASIPSITDQIQFARFAQVAMLKMLAFVDVVADVDLWRQLYSSLQNLDTYHKLLNLLLGVHGALSKALHVINVLFISSPPGEVERILGEIFGLLSTKEEKALDAVWLTLNATTTHVLNRIQDSSATQTLQQGSSDIIHKVTLSVISHITFLMDNKLSLDPIVSDEADNRGGVYGSRIGDLTHFDSMIIRMASRLEEKLASLSESSFPDQGLKFLFLLNNSHQLHQCLRLEPGWSSLQEVVSLVNRVDDHMQSYLQLSWAPVLSCLFSPTPSFLGKNYSPLTRFESEFQNTYTTQKLWKVPDPELRKTLRTAIMDKLIPSYIKYIEDNNITTPGLAPQELEEMLQDLFEG